MPRRVREVSMKRKAAKAPDRVVRARIRLWQAIDRACAARGEAQWTNGYRTGAGKPLQEDERLYQRETSQWADCVKMGEVVEKAIAAYARSLK